jgi:hypothetical protein
MQAVDLQEPLLYSIQPFKQGVNLTPPLFKRSSLKLKECFKLLKRIPLSAELPPFYSQQQGAAMALLEKKLLLQWKG